MPPVSNGRWYFYTQNCAGATEEVILVIRIKMSEKEIRMEGHAGYHIAGKDIVCAAVSALTCNLINSLHELAKAKIDARTDSGLTIIRWEELSEPAKILIDSWFLGMTAINQEYNCITFE